MIKTFMWIGLYFSLLYSTLTISASDNATVNLAIDHQNALRVAGILMVLFGGEAYASYDSKLAKSSGTLLCVSGLAIIIASNKIVDLTQKLPPEDLT